MDSPRQPLLSKSSEQPAADKSTKSMASPAAQKSATKSVAFDKSTKSAAKDTSEKSQKSQKSQKSTLSKAGDANKSQTRSVADKSQKKSVRLVDPNAKDGDGPRRKGPKREDPAIYHWTPSYTAAMICYLLTLYVIIFVYMLIVMVPTYHLYKDAPTHTGYGSFIGVVPAVYIEPNPDAVIEKAGGELKYNTDNFASYSALMRQMHSFAQRYNGTRKACSRARMAQLDGRFTNETCPAVDPNEKNPYLGLGICELTEFNIGREDYHFGWEYGTPCLAVSFTKILGVYPDDLTQFYFDRKAAPNSSDYPSSIQIDHIRYVEQTQEYTLANAIEILEHRCASNNTQYTIEDCCEWYRFNVECWADDAKVVIRQYPVLGASLCPLPYWNQTGHQHPYVTLQLENMPSNKEVNIYCKSKAREWQQFPNDEDNVKRITITLQAFNREKPAPPPKAHWGPQPTKATVVIPAENEGNSTISPATTIAPEQKKQQP
ncbi:unnamed protein product, partial [Mesorhabditis spiculigera]